MSVRISTLGEQATIIMGQSPPGDSYNRNGLGTPLLNGPTEFGTVHPVEQQWTESPTKTCKRGDLLFCVRGATAGRINIADKEYCLGRGLAAIRVKEGIFDSGFLRHVVTNGYRTFQSRGVGSTFINISKEELARFEVPAPPVAEQRRIAAILDKADELRAKRRAALDQLNRLTQAAFVESFGDPLRNPRGWRLLPLNDCCEVINDCPHSTPKWTETGVVCLRTTNLTEGGWNWADKRFVTEDAYVERSSRGFIEPGDIILSREGTVGIAAIVQPDMRVCMGQRLVQVRPAPTLLNSDYLLMVLLYVLAPSRVSRLMVGSTAQHLNVGELRALRVPIPPLASQTTFSNQMCGVRDLQENSCRSAKYLDALFDSLQHRAFSGAL